MSAAVILFGIAYGLYAIVLYKFAAPRLRSYGGFAYRARWLIVAVVAAANTATWVLHIRNSVLGQGSGVVD
ncbi:hypothetical protein [Mycobacterium ulcerans]|uniref:hypothetical protein n=1 Tax=Mycobacterium ulcerans TaxID=1809 RepID=UPI00214B27DD|nr:hypothetical protein [Mycobacterium ulcerans]